jgi:hypothetical protein
LKKPDEDLSQVLSCTGKKIPANRSGGNLGLSPPFPKFFRNLAAIEVTQVVNVKLSVIHETKPSAFFSGGKNTPSPGSLHSGPRMTFFSGGNNTPSPGSLHSGPRMTFFSGGIPSRRYAVKEGSNEGISIFLVHRLGLVRS